MKRTYHPYQKWECHKNGMWIKGNSETELATAIEFTGNHILYGEAMREVIEKWKFSCDNFLSNISINRKAYLGHAAVSLKLKIPENITRQAWKFLTEEQRILANKQAEINIKIWEQKKELGRIVRVGNRDVTMEEYQMKLHLSWN